MFYVRRWNTAPDRRGEMIEYLKKKKNYSLKKINNFKNYIYILTVFLFNLCLWIDIFCLYPQWILWLRTRNRSVTASPFTRYDLCGTQHINIHVAVLFLLVVLKYTILCHRYLCLSRDIHRCMLGWCSGQIGWSRRVYFRSRNFLLFPDKDIT